MKKILIADDDEAIRELLKVTFAAADFETFLVENGSSVLEMTKDQTFDLLLLDLMMPDLSGIEVTEKLRAQGNVTPILILTAREDDEAKLRGLDLGADDYLEKTRSMKEVVQRAKGLIRRYEDYNRTSESHNKVDFNDLSINFEQNLVFLDNQPVKLTKREFEILAYLIRHKNHIVSRDRLLEKFWGTTKDVETRTIDVLISRLRKKLAGNYIITKHGQGVLFDENFKK